jgi:hypothetical protein
MSALDLSESIIDWPLLVGRYWLLASDVSLAFGNALLESFFMGKPNFTALTD